MLVGLSFLRGNAYKSNNNKTDAFPPRRWEREIDGSTKVGNFFEIIAKYQEISEHEYDLFGAGEIMQRVNLLELTDKLLQEVDSEDVYA